MSEKIEKYMDWPNIEGVLYAENDNPHQVLGAKKLGGKVLITCFFPDAIQVATVLNKGDKSYKMYKMEEEGYFAALLPYKKIPDYHYEVSYEEGSVVTMEETYNFTSTITKTDMNRFSNGIHTTIYEKLGAHSIVHEGIVGVVFAVWAPYAMSVSVVGDFNLWDGRRHLMSRLGDSGIFELFIPNLGEGEIYKYEVHGKGGKIVLKSDPYGYYAERRPNTASVVWNIDKFQWNDQNYLEKRKNKNFNEEPMIIYEMQLGSFRKPESKMPSESFYNYRELAPMVTDYCKGMGYTHIELMPVMEHPLDASWGYQVTGYYAPTSRHGTPDDFMYFVDYLHQANLGVILDWVPAHFPKDEHGLAQFDGTCLYEHLDKRQGEHPHWGTLIYNYGRPQVENFLVANALYWLDKYHVDGIRFDAVASMLYLDYGKKDGEWIANIYGGNENLEAMEMIRRLNLAVKKRKDGTFTIAEESTAWPNVTGAVVDGGLGFDYKWNMGWMNDFLDYMRTDPLWRKGKHGMLTFSMVYHYSEKFVLVVSHDEVVHGKGSMNRKMPGDKKERFANLRVAFGFMATHPGKMLTFMGQEFGVKKEWDEKKELAWDLIEEDNEHGKLQRYVRDLNEFYVKNDPLYQKDYQVAGFEWISMLDADRSVIAFLRRSDEDTLLVVCNFTPVTYEKFVLGVPFPGKYKEVFNSDEEKYGGTGVVNPRLKNSKTIKSDGKKDSIEIKLPPLGISIFRCTPVQKR